jgi:hypothetical protein
MTRSSTRRSASGSRLAHSCGSPPRRALVEGRQHFELSVGAALLANNLMVIADLSRTSTRRYRLAA